MRKRELERRVVALERWALQHLDEIHQTETTILDRIADTQRIMLTGHSKPRRRAGEERTDG